MIKIIFDRSLQTGKLTADWMKANVMPMFQRAEVSDLSLSLAFFARSATNIVGSVLGLYNDLPDEVRPE